MNEYMIEIMNEAELTDEEMAYVNAHKSWRRNYKKQQLLDEPLETQ
jgi:hypothetical protein